MYEAAADKIGLLGGALAPKVASFFTAMDRIGVNADLIANLPPDTAVEDKLLRALVALIEQNCRDSLPLLDALRTTDAMRNSGRGSTPCRRDNSDLFDAKKIPVEEHFSGKRKRLRSLSKVFCPRQTSTVGDFRPAHAPSRRDPEFCRHRAT